MKEDFQEIARSACMADEIFHIEDIQSLWSGYGKIMRYGLKGGDRASVVIKHVKLPGRAHHPRGWNSSLSHERKVRSYRVESAWYRDWAGMCDESCRLPHCLALEESDDEFLMVLEDLDAGGYPLRRETATMAEMEACLSWLANFHATFMGMAPKGLWPVGTYWHLDTRPDELEALGDAALKAAAEKIDKQLSSARYQTFVHGDAKLANFCFAEEGGQVAAVDFQYVGGGSGIKDVAYFIGSCLFENQCEEHESELLDFYFSALREALKVRAIEADPDSRPDPDLVEQEWRMLYDLAWTDFHRFVKGWSPGHWKIHNYSERKARHVVAGLKGGA